MLCQPSMSQNIMKQWSGFFACYEIFWSQQTELACLIAFGQAILVSISQMFSVLETPISQEKVQILTWLFGYGYRSIEVKKQKQKKTKKLGALTCQKYLVIIFRGRKLFFTYVKWLLCTYTS